jgi:predicted nicotinamide N-methyase
MLSRVGLTAVQERDFVLAQTRLTRLPFVPELRLHLAEGITSLWERTEAELGAVGTDPPFWAFGWAGGQAVGRYLLDRPGEVTGKTVLDLAAGSGLGAIAAVLAGARSALAADIGPFAGAAVAVNAAANGVHIDFTARDLLDTAPPVVDIVLAGDVCYERRMTERVLAWLAAAQGRGARVLLGDPRRAFLPAAGLVRLAEYAVPTPVDLEGMAVRRTTVYTLSPLVDGGPPAAAAAVASS